VNPVKWFGVIVVYTVVTLLCVYLIPSGSALSFLTYFFGFTFVAVVPGYCFVSLLFQEGKLDLIEKIVLSVALSFSIAGVSGLFIGLSPIGINVNSITVSLSGIVVVLAVLAFLRKMKLLPQLRAKSSSAASTDV
jgi:uncharacterized membrane protein